MAVEGMVPVFVGEQNVIAVKGIESPSGNRTVPDGDNCGTLAGGNVDSMVKVEFSRNGA